LRCNLPQPNVSVIRAAPQQRPNFAFAALSDLCQFARIRSHYSGATATTPASIALVQEFYSPGLERNAPPATDPGVQYWVHSGLDAAQLLEAFSQSPQFTEEMQPQITIFQNAEITGTLGVLAGLPYPEYL